MNSALNIAYIDHTGQLGGAEHLLLGLLRDLPRNKIMPVLFCGADGTLGMQAEKLGIHTEIMILPKFFSTSWVLGSSKILNPFAVLWNGITLVFAAWQLRRKIRDLQIDIIQTNSVLSHLYGGMAARSLKIPCVWYFHDLIETRRLFGIIALIWRMLASIFPHWIVADSQAVLNHLSAGARGKVIYPGIVDKGLDHGKPVRSLCERLDLPDSSVFVGSLGRISYVKGLDVLIDAARMVVRKNQNIHFVLFGGALFGEENYGTQLEEKVKQFGLSSYWHWMGYDEFALEYLKEFNFLVFPSRREAFGLACIEAGLSGKAVIATSVGGIPEIIENGRTGILVPSENAELLALAISNLASNPQLATALGENARIRVKSLFNKARFMDEFLDFYETLRV